MSRWPRGGWYPEGDGDLRRAYRDAGMEPQHARGGPGRVRAGWADDDDPDTWLGWADAADSKIRASDADRSRVARMLWSAHHHGALTADEADERVQVACAARFRAELAGLISDVPRSARMSGPRRRSGLPRPDTRRLMFHAATAAAAAVALVGLWALFPARFFWPVIPISFMTLGVVGHGLRLRGRRS